MTSHFTRFSFVVGVFSATCFVATAQTTSPAKVLAPLVPAPFGLKGKVKAMGSHFATAGNERLTFTGLIRHGNGLPLPMVATHELPRKFKYQEGLLSIVFNGTALGSLSSLTADNQGLLESLFEDSADGLFPSFRTAPLLRLLVNGSRLDDGVPSSYQGPLLSVFQIVVPVASLPGAPQRAKFLYFSQDTNLLDRVRYVSAGTRVETRFQNWQTFNGTSVPTFITRTEAGVIKLSATISSVSVAAAANDGTFQLP